MKKKIISIIPFPVIMICICIILFFLVFKNISFFNIIIIILCIASISFYQQLILYEDMFVLNTYFLFFIKIKSNKVLFKNVKEIILKTYTVEKIIYSPSTSNRIASYVESKEYNLYIINNDNNIIIIIKTSNYKKVYIIGRFFQKFFNINIKETFDRRSIE